MRASWTPEYVLIILFSTIFAFSNLFMVLFVDLSVEYFYGLIIAWGVLAFILLCLGITEG